MLATNHGPQGFESRWPAEHGWVAYNSLQLLAYFATIFIAAPAALLTGLGMSPALSTRFKRISGAFSIQTARSLHFLVLRFLVFIVTHVALVFTTGLLNNLNHIYAVRDDNSGIGLAIFALSMAVATAGWLAATPFTLRHPRVVQRVGFALIGPAQRLFEHLDSTPGAYTERDISPYFWHNGQYPDSDEYSALFDNQFGSITTFGFTDALPAPLQPLPAGSSVRPPARLHAPHFPDAPQPRRSGTFCDFVLL